MTTAYVLLGDDNSVLEYGGHLQAICSILRKLIEEGNYPFLKLFTPPQQDDLAAYMEELRIPKNSIYLGMIRVISQKKILGKFGEDTLRACPSGKLSKLLFGPEKQSKEASPIMFYLWQSEHC